MTFKELNIADSLLKAISEKGYNCPTPIQIQGIPIALSGQDILGIAQTGTGKTAAFAIPILQHLSKNNTSFPVSQDLREKKSFPERKNKPEKRYCKREIQALILTPTRELALQIGDSFTDYGKYTGLRHCVIFGGIKQLIQTTALQRGVDILVATPGRLLDLMNQGFVDLSSLKHFVLDEADRMLDMGFINDIKRILLKLPIQHQTLLFSATMPQSIAALSASILKKPVRVEVSPVSSPVDTVEQCIYFVEKMKKKNLLVQLLGRDIKKSVLVFSRTKHGADNIARSLSKEGIRTESIHGNKSQGQRQRALNAFKSGKVKVMVATDIAARGIDIDRLEMVINYDLPDTAETYVHRIGRTGRAGNTGTALTFCAPDEKVMVKEIQKLTGKKLRPICIPA